MDDRQLRVTCLELAVKVAAVQEATALARSEPAPDVPAMAQRFYEFVTKSAAQATDQVAPPLPPYGMSVTTVPECERKTLAEWAGLADAPAEVTGAA